MANDTELGLAAHFYSRNIGREGTKYDIEERLDVKYLWMTRIDG
jgi:hypothetical protein